MNTQHQEYSDSELQQAEEMNAALDTLRRGVSPEFFSADPAFQTLLRFHIQTSETEADEEFIDEVEELLLARFAQQKGENENAIPARMRMSFWRVWTMPLVSLAIVAVVIVGISSDIIPLNFGALREGFSPPLNINKLSNRDANTNTNTGNTNAPATPEPEPLPSVTDVPGLAALGIEDDMAEIEFVKKDVESAMIELETFAAEVDALNDAGDVESILNDFESINL